MAGKGKRGHHGLEEESEGKGEPSGDLQVLLRVLLESNAKAEAERREERIESDRRAAQERMDAEKRAQEREDRREEARIARRVEETRAARELEKVREEAAMELEKVKEEAAREASERLRKQQQEAADRAYEQQKLLVELQAQIGGKAAEAHRVESEKGRKRDRAVSAIPNYRDSEDVEDFLQTSERKLRAGEVPEGEWVAILASKMGGKVGTTWQDLSMAGEGYEEIKAALLKVCGYTPKLAGEAFFGFKGEALRGMSADQLYHRGVQLLRRMVAPLRVPADFEFAVLKPWVWSVVSRRAKTLLDARVASTPSELIGALQDHLVMEGERTEGHAAVFRKLPQGSESSGNSSSGERRVSGPCFKCGKPGHRAVDCWQKGGANTSGASKPVGGPSSSGGSKIVCYTCGVEGHKSTQCTQGTRVKKEGQPKPVRQLWHRDVRDTVLEGVVSGERADILLDSGASISIVPEEMVGQELRTGEVVAVKAFQSKKPLLLPTARVGFKIDQLEWEEEVALAPVETGKENEVLYGLDLKTERGLQLVLIANKRGQPEVLRVTTRSEAGKEAAEKAEEERVVAVEKPKVKSVADNGVGRLGEGELVEDRPADTPEPGPVVSEASEGEGDRVADRPARDPSSMMDAEEEEEAGDSSAEEEDMLEELEDEELFCVRTRSGEPDDLVIPPVGPGNSSRAELVEAVKADPSLESWRALADKGEQGFSWQDGLVYQAITTHTLEVAHLMVLPTKFRKSVLTLAHERSGHLGARKVKALIRQRFVWPEMAKEAVIHCQSCDVCQKCRKSKSRKVPLMEREVLSQGRSKRSGWSGFGRTTFL